MISNNLANVDTVAFNRDRANFQDMMYQKIHQPGGRSSQNTELSSGLMLGTGVKVVGTSKTHIVGNLLQTDNALDLDIEGRGFFKVLLHDGTEAYSRDGRFQLDKDGRVVTNQGYPLQPEVNLSINAESTIISPDGVVSVLATGEAEPSEVGQVMIFDFINPEGLEPMGGNMYKPSVSSGLAQQLESGTQGVAAIRQGFTESSNVNVVQEMVDLISTQRHYEMCAKCIATQDEMAQFTTQVV